MGIADQLSSNLTRTKYGYDPETLNVWQRVQPVMVELIQVKNLGGSPSGVEQKAARLKYFIASQTWMEKRRINVSEEWLLRQVGEFSDEEPMKAADEATAMMKKQEVGTNWI